MKSHETSLRSDAAKLDYFCRRLYPFSGEVSVPKLGGKPPVPALPVAPSPLLRPLPHSGHSTPRSAAHRASEHARNLAMGSMN